MNSRLVPAGVLAVALVGCQNSDYIDPDDENTGTPPPEAGTVFSFDSTRAPTYLDANLEQTNAVQAVFVNTEAGITVMPVNGALPDFAGAEANLLDGVGFATYPNPDYREDVDWATAGDFSSTVTAEITFTSPGDTVLICRSFATTCVELVSSHPLAQGLDLAIMRLAANAPDTEIGEISTGVSAAIRGTGDAGLTIAITDQGTVGIPFNATAGEPFTLTWTISRGALENSIDWSVTFGEAGAGASGNSATDLAAAIEETGGVALIFDAPFSTGLGVEVQYTYTFDGHDNNDAFYAGSPAALPEAFRVPLSPQIGLGYTPLQVYLTDDPAHEFGTYTGLEGVAHAVEPGDGILGLVTEAQGTSRQHFVYSTAFNGDDFADATTVGADPGEGIIDYGVEGGGFYPSPSFCYSQILPGVEAKVQAAVRTAVHQQMYAQLATGVTQADASLPTLVAGFNASELSDALGDMTYTDLNTASLADSIAIGTDYADSNVDTAIITSFEDEYDAELNVAVATTFRTQLGAIVATLLTDVGGDAVWELMGLTFDTQVAPLQTLDAALNTPTGSQDGLSEADDYPPTHPPSGPCAGYDCNVAVITNDIVMGTNYSTRNPSGLGTPVLTSACLWGLPPSAAVAATNAVLVPNGSFTDDFPAYPAIPAAPATPPIREIASASMNDLVMGIYGNFIGAVFGPGVPASNFSLAMGAGNPDAASGPILTSLTITAD